MHPVLLMILLCAAAIGYLTHLEYGAAVGVLIVGGVFLVIVIIGSVLDKIEERRNPELARLRQIKRRLGLLL